MRILSLIVTFFAVTTLSAQRLDYLVIRKLNGNEYFLNISSGATINFTDTSIDITAKPTEPSWSYALESLKSLLFVAEPTGINDVTNTAISATFSGNTLQVTAPTGSNVNVYNLDGRAVATLKKSTNGNERFSLPLSKGVYVVRIGQQTFKLLAQ